MECSDGAPRRRWWVDGSDPHRLSKLRYSNCSLRLQPAEDSVVTQNHGIIGVQVLVFGWKPVGQITVIITPGPIKDHSADIIATMNNR